MTSADPLEGSGDPSFTLTTEPAHLHLATMSAAAIREGRQFVERQTVARGATAVLDDVALAAAELLANAAQHASPPVTVSIAGDASCIRLEVADGTARPPVRPSPSATNMTGRGLVLVEGVATRWGVDRSELGKVVWAEFEPAAAPRSVEVPDVDDLLAQWGEEGTQAGDRRYTVVLGDVPTDLLIEAKAHIDNLVREFSMADANQTTAPPPDLARLITAVVHGFADARDVIKRQALAAARRGEPRTRLSLRLPESAADAGEAYLRALDEADGYARAARLLTLESPASHRLFRNWYVNAVVRQLRDVAAGREPEPVIPFEAHMLEEIERLASLQRVSDRGARLQRVTAALARAETPEDVAAVVVREGVAALGASGGGLLVPADDGEHLAVPGTFGYQEELIGALRDEPLDAPLPAATVLRTAEAIWLESRTERDERFPALRGFEASVVSMCAVPLVVGGRTLGALRFSFDSRRLFDDEERSFVLALAAQTAQTLLRTETYAAERQASLNLQRALLPQGIPSIPNWDLAAHYSPAGEQQAGGDFYDVIPLVDGRVVVAVGDVMGRGVEAAAAMAQVRTVIRAYAIDNPDPADVFAKVDKYFLALDVVQLVTVLYLLLEPDSGAVSIANAGHLPPVLIDGNGSRLAETEVGIAFGVGVSDRRTFSRIVIPHEGGVVACTDGLVERRDEDIDVGIGRVLAAAGEGGGCTDAQALLTKVLLAAAPAGHVDDDVTVVTMCRC